MSDIVALLRQLIRAEIARFTPSVIGTVDSVKSHAGPEDPVNYTCDVKLRESGVVLYDVPMATSMLGLAAPPAEGDAVLVHFVGGDPDFPVVGGRVYSDELRPPPYAQGQAVMRMPAASADGARIDIELQGGTAGERSFKLKLPETITITVSDQSVSLQSDTLKLTLDAEGKKATLETAAASFSADDSGNVSIKGDASVKITTEGDLSITATGKLSLKADGEVEIQGSIINLN